MGMERNFLGLLNFSYNFAWDLSWIFNYFHWKNLLKIQK